MGGRRTNPPPNVEPKLENGSGILQLKWSKPMSSKHTIHKATKSTVTTFHFIFNWVSIGPSQQPLMALKNGKPMTKTQPREHHPSTVLVQRHNPTMSPHCITLPTIEKPWKLSRHYLKPTMEKHATLSSPKTMPVSSAPGTWLASTFGQVR